MEKEVGEGSLEAWGETASVREEEAARHARMRAHLTISMQALSEHGLLTASLCHSFCSMLSSP